MTVAGGRKALMGIDLGTTAVKVGLFEVESGKAIAVVRQEYSPLSPAPGWMELDAQTYWDSTVVATRKAMEEGGRPEVLGIGLSSQGQTFVPLDEGFRPLRPAIVWLDTRAEEQAAYLRTAFDPDEYRRRAWLPFPSAIDSACKILWLRRNEPEAWERTRYIMLLPDYIGFRLTEARLLDVNDAQSTGLVDHDTADWWPEALAVVGVPADWMSPIGRPGQRVGALKARAAEELGLRKDIPVSSGSNDQLSGAVGVGNVRPGLVSGTVGTAMALLSTVREVGLSAARGLLCGPHAVAGLFFILTYGKTSGVLLTWLRDLMAPGRSYADLLAEAESVPPGSDGLVCLPHFSGTATPTFRSDVCGGFTGLTLAHGRGHFVRAVVEAVCFLARDALSLATSGGQHVTGMRVLGGATQSDFWMQMLADVVRVPLELPECGEAAVLGAAIFGGVGAGWFKSIEEGSQAFYKPRKVFLPREEAALQYDHSYGAYRDAMERVYPGALGEQG